MIKIPKRMDAQLKKLGYVPNDTRDTWKSSVGVGWKQFRMHDLAGIKSLNDIPRILAQDIPSDFHSYELCGGGGTFSGMWINERIKPFLRALLELDWEAV